MILTEETLLNVVDYGMEEGRAPHTAAVLKCSPKPKPAARVVKQ